MSERGCPIGLWDGVQCKEQLYSALSPQLRFRSDCENKMILLGELCFVRRLTVLCSSADWSLPSAVTGWGGRGSSSSARWRRVPVQQRRCGGRCPDWRLWVLVFSLSSLHLASCMLVRLWENDRQNKRDWTTELLLTACQVMKTDDCPPYAVCLTERMYDWMSVLIKSSLHIRGRLSHPEAAMVSAAGCCHVVAWDNLEGLLFWIDGPCLECLCVAPRAALVVVHVGGQERNKWGCKYFCIVI